jgi:quercetin dioxygenase-like cupin family protein
MPTTSFASHAVPVTTYDSRGVTARHIASGTGDSHAYVLQFTPGGEIGSHVAGFDQMFLVLSGSAWIEVNGERTELSSFGAVLLRRGDSHTTGSVTGATALIMQSDQLTPGEPGVLP